MPRRSDRLDPMGSTREPVRNPRLLSKQIVERLRQIRRALDEEPSEVEVEMCALGYGVCADDMIALGLLVEEELAGAGPLRRARLQAFRRKAASSLSLTREAFPRRPFVSHPGSDAKASQAELTFRHPGGVPLSSRPGASSPSRRPCCAPPAFW